MGSYSVDEITTNFHILNCYMQYRYRRFHCQILSYYNAIRSCLYKINTEYDGWEIGCRLAGGNCGVVSKIFEQELVNQDVTIYFV